MFNALSSELLDNEYSVADVSLPSVKVASGEKQG